MTEQEFNAQSRQEAAEATRESATIPTRPATKPPQRQSYLPEIQRMLPQSADAEQGLICSLLLAPPQVAALCWSKGVTPDWFHVPAHATLFGLAMELADAGQIPDIIMLTQMLRDRKLLDQVGGPAFVSDVFTFLPTAANATFYLETIEEKFTLREIIRVCTEYAARCYDEQSEVTTLLDEAEARILKISRERYTQASRGISGKHLAEIGLNAILKQAELRDRISGISTGFNFLDGLTDGLHEQEFIAVAGKSGTGKSALAMQIIEHLTFDQRIPCAVWPLEMGRRQLAKRTILSRARINPYEWRHRHASDAELATVRAVAAELKDAPLYIEDASDCTIQRIRAQARRLVSNHGVKVILIDSLSALHSDTRQGRDNRVREAAECSEGCKEMAKELNVTVILICHIGKDLPREQRPQPADLRETGKVELDADSLWFLSEPEWNMNQPTLSPEIEVYIPKQRDGEPFTHGLLTFEKKWTRFVEPEQTTAQGALL